MCTEHNRAAPKTLVILIKNRGIAVAVFYCQISKALAYRANQKHRIPLETESLDFFLFYTAIRLGLLA